MMDQNQASHYCAHCQQDVVAAEETPNHLLHFVLTLVTLGLWVPIWILATLGIIARYRCTQCGNRV